MESGVAGRTSNSTRDCTDYFPSICQRHFKKNELQPHKSRYWLNPKIEDWKAFLIRVAFICNLLLAIIKAGKNSGKHLLSVDEKTGIQALERISPDHPMRKGKPRRVEYEYKLNGTTTLMAGLNIATGTVIHHRLHPTRTEEDYLVFIQELVEPLPQEDEVIIMADQLNTHKSASLVQWIAEKLNFEGDLGKKGDKGILKSQKSRMEFLENPEHRIRFVFTPKHCSWLNPIENWFSKLERHVIKYGNFSSVKELENNIRDYIIYYNRCLFKPLKWKFKGYLNVVKNKNLIVEKLRA